MLRTSVIRDLRLLPDEVAQAMLQRVRAVTSAGTVALQVYAALKLLFANCGSRP
jgi:hypothetical protein